MTGKIHIITGPMGAGKSFVLEALVTMFHRNHSAMTIGFRPLADTRAPHNCIGNLHAYHYDTLRSAVNFATGVKGYSDLPWATYIDEIQLFPDAARAGEILPELARAGHTVYAAGLQYGWAADEIGKPFRFTWADFVPQYDGAITIDVVPTCACRNNYAFYTRRLTPLPLDDSPICGHDEVMACCLDCWRPPPEAAP